MNGERYALTVRSSFSAAHRLLEYEGNCDRLHGHNWQVEVTVESEVLDARGMALDFRVMKASLNEILARLDHEYLNEVPPFDGDGKKGGTPGPPGPGSRVGVRGCVGRILPREPVAALHFAVHWPNTATYPCMTPGGKGRSEEEAPARPRQREENRLPESPRCEVAVTKLRT